MIPVFERIASSYIEYVLKNINKVEQLTEKQSYAILSWIRYLPIDKISTEEIKNLKKIALKNFKESNPKGRKKWKD